MNKQTQQGIDAYKAGDLVAARYYLKQALQQDRLDIQAWLWLSAVSEDNADKAFCLQTILRLDPGNEIARRGLAKLESGQFPEEMPAPPEEAPAARSTQEPGGYVPPFIFSEEELVAFEPFLNEPETNTAVETAAKGEGEAGTEAVPQAKPAPAPEQDLRAAFSANLSPLPSISMEEEQPEQQVARPAPQRRKSTRKPAAKSSFRPWMWAVLVILLLLIIIVALEFVLLAFR